MQNKIEDLFLGKILQNVVYLTSISHADKARAVMFDVKVLIQEGVSNIDTSSSCTISVLKVTTYKTKNTMTIHCWTVKKMAPH